MPGKTGYNLPGNAGPGCRCDLPDRQVRRRGYGEGRRNFVLNPGYGDFGVLVRSTGEATELEVNQGKPKLTKVTLTIEGIEGIEGMVE